MCKLDLDYWLTQATDERPGKLSQQDLADAIANMKPVEFAKLNEAFCEYNHVAVAISIRESIVQQYEDEIIEQAHQDHADYLEDLKEDSKERE